VNGASDTPSFSRPQGLRVPRPTYPDFLRLLACFYRSSRVFNSCCCELLDAMDDAPAQHRGDLAALIKDSLAYATLTNLETICGWAEDVQRAQLSLILTQETKTDDR
jgi:hypothetical protein